MRLYKTNMRKTTLAITLITLLFGCNTGTKDNGQLITLSNGTIEIGILPAVGGRLVRASLKGHKNIIQSDSTQWNESPEKRASLDPMAPFKAYNGSISWLSPQSEWWVKQDSLPKLKAYRSLWPPDPMLTLAPYKITDQKANEITLTSPESRFSKVQFIKTFRIDGNRVTLITRARNCSKDTVSWGLWHNTRMNGWDNVFVKADSTDLIKTQYMKQGETRKPNLRYRDGFYTYDVAVPENAKTVYKSKSFLNVKAPLIAGFHENQWLIIRSDAIDNTKIHPEEARIELYIENSYQAVSDLQELEIQYVYQKIAPGASIEASETWEILPGSGLKDKKSLRRELMGKLK